MVGVQDDYYLNLVDWSSTNVLGVGLGACVYLWSAHTSAVTKLCDLSENGGTDSITSINWVEKVSPLSRYLTCTDEVCRDLNSRSVRKPGVYRSGTPRSVVSSAR